MQVHNGAPDHMEHTVKSLAQQHGAVMYYKPTLLQMLSLTVSNF